MTAERRLAVVSGGGAGIGQAICVRLAQDGFDIAIADVAAADETVALVEGVGASALAVPTDVSSLEAVEAFAAAVLERWGRCDVLVANAGIYPLVSLEETTPELWHRVIAINLDSLFYLTRAFLPGMRAAGWGRIVAIASNTFLLGVGHHAAYVASKGGMIGFIRSLAADVGNDGVTANAIAPNLTRTPGTEAGPHTELGIFEFARERQAIGRTQMPADIVGTVSFVVSDDAAFMTGQTLVIDGGTARV
jgi:NAD(P)-dependent dehydrogenase (short-subunit alcohol dehydrogenase family)